ncbi:MAG: hypothetical protein Q4D36_10605 [Bacteroidales bacterium]|nr:hypothetical protein [Bacteroidales bacterium]
MEKVNTNIDNINNVENIENPDNAKNKNNNNSKNSMTTDEGKIFNFLSVDSLRESHTLDL